MKSYKLSANLRAELSRARKKSSSFDYSLVKEYKIPWRKVAISALSLVLILGAYYGTKKTFDYASAKRQLAKAKAQAADEQRIQNLKSDVKTLGKTAFDFAKLSQEFAQKNELEKATACAEESVELDRNWRDGYVNLAQIYLFTDRVFEAQTQAEKALEIDPNNGQTHYLLSEIYKKQKLNDKSNQELELAKALGYDTEFGGN